VTENKDRKDKPKQKTTQVTPLGLEPCPCPDGEARGEEDIGLLLPRWMELVADSLDRCLGFLEIRVFRVFGV
jgi:hypothetical protein